MTSARRSTLVGMVAGVLVIALVAGGAFALVELRGSGSPTSEGPVARPSALPSGALPSTDPALASYYGQSLQWTPCVGADRCATMKVPLDYAHPQGRSLDLALLKVPAGGRAIGSLVVNPGGPGASAIRYAESGAAGWPAELLRSYDLVGVDPRGVGQSTPLHCLDTVQTDRLVAADPEPDTNAERVRLDGLFRAFGNACLARSGDLARHMSTVEVARDLDVLRALLREPRLSYFGASYGTLIGATYANLFPTHVGRMVLDGAIDPKLSNEQVSLQQGHGFEVALRAYVQDCVSQGGCVLGDSVDAGTKRIRAFLDSVERRPLPTSGGRDLQVGNAVFGIWLPLYVKQYWPLLTNALTAAIDKGDGTGLMSLSDQYVERGPNGYDDNSLEALVAVNCLDHDDSVPSSRVPAHFAQFEKASPTFGRTFAYGLSTCSVWPVRSGKVTHAIHAKGAPPIVVVGTTRDPATPYAWAKGLASELDAGVLVSRDGDGHTGYNQGNACVDDAVNGYLVSGLLPKDGLSC